jgi:large subunit ribosomal protein L19e
MATTLETQKRIASRILKCGTSRIWIEPDAVNEVATAMTAGDVRKFIGLGYIKEAPAKGNSRSRHDYRVSQVKKGRRRGYGSRKGAGGARQNQKELWIAHVRAQRKILQSLLAEKIIDREKFRNYYAMLKPGNFKSKAHLLTYLKEQGISFSKKGKKKAAK